MIERVSPHPDQLGECPVWDPEGFLYWEDIEGRRLHRLEVSSGEVKSTDTPGRPGSFAMTSTPGRFLLAMENELGWFDFDNAIWESWLVLEPSGQLAMSARTSRSV